MMQTIELPYEIGKKVYVLASCYSVAKATTNVDCGDKGVAQLTCCPRLEHGCPHNISTAKECTREVTWKNAVFEGEIIGYDYSARGLKVALKGFYSTFDLNDISVTEEEAQAKLDAYQGSPMY